MIDAEPGALTFTAVNQEYTKPCRIIGCLWVGSTVSGDVATIKGRLGSHNKTMWEAQTDSGNTYLGAIWGPPGIHAPDGFKVDQLMGGKLHVYISQ